MELQRQQLDRTLVSSSPPSPAYKLLDIIAIQGNVGYTKESESVPFINRSTYSSLPSSSLFLVGSFVNHGYGPKHRTLFQSAAYRARNAQRVHNLLKLGGNPDYMDSGNSMRNTDDKTEGGLSALVYSILGENTDTVHFLMEQHYEPLFRLYEKNAVSPAVVIVKTPVQSPVPTLEKIYHVLYPVVGPIEQQAMLFSSLKMLSLHYDFDQRNADTIVTNPPLCWQLSNGTKVPVTNIHSLRTILHSLLYSVPSTNPFVTFYSDLWISETRFHWITNLITGMILCQESHPNQYIIDAWKRYVPSSISYETYPFVLPYIVCLYTKNFPLFTDLWKQTVPLSNPNDIHDLGCAIGYYGGIDEFRYIYGELKPKTNVTGTDSSVLVDTFLQRTVVWAVKRHHLPLLKDIKDVPEFRWNTIQWQTMVTEEDTEITQWLQSMVQSTTTSSSSSSF